MRAAEHEKRKVEEKKKSRNKMGGILKAGEHVLGAGVRHVWFGLEFVALLSGCPGDPVGSVVAIFNVGYEWKPCRCKTLARGCIGNALYSGVRLCF